MYRPAVVLGLLIPLLAANAEAKTQVAPARITPFEGEATLLVRWQLGVRDLARRISDRLAELASESGFRVPDLTILTTFPLPTSTDSWETSGFGWRDDPMRHRRKFHSGADVRAKPGTPVFAAGAGVVTFAARKGGYGNMVIVDHGGGVITRYAHLRRIHAKAGATIIAGERLGQVGSTGRTTGPHLHFEVRLDDNPVDPTTALTVGELQRESPDAARIAVFALVPELQSLEISPHDPPRVRTPREPRPARTGYVKRVRPVS
jgi:murein DD-endopeptidase MepM/ murein hydrolase activator NlpD